METVPVRFGRGRLDSLATKGLAAYLIVRNQLGATRRLLNFFSPRFGAGKPVCGKTSFRELFTRRERLLYEGISIGRRDHSSW